MDSKREMLRHCLATLAYRGGKVLRGAPDEFANYRAAETSSDARRDRRAPCRSARLGAVNCSRTASLENSEAVGWQAGADRFFASLTALDQYLASSDPLDVSPEQLFQAPIAGRPDAHVGQLAMLRRMAGTLLAAKTISLRDIEAAGPLAPNRH